MQSKTVSYHEAAHAAMCMSLGIPFKKVTIIPNGNLRGHVDAAGHEIRGLWQLVGAIECIMAGPVAVANIKKEPISIQKFSDSDRKGITRLLNENEKTISKAEAADFMSWVFTRTKKHLAERWASVERIAQALEATRTLSYLECKELMK